MRSRVAKELTHLPEGRLVRALRFTLDLLFAAEASLPFPAAEGGEEWGWVQKDDTGI